MSPFLDTSVLLAGLIDFGPQSRPANLVLHAVAEKKIPSAATAWHCCLEFYSVATRLPPEFRLLPSDAGRLLEEEVFDRMAVHDLPGRDRSALIRTASEERSIGGRIYDFHIAEIARASRADVIITDNRRHFLASLRYGIRIETPSEFLASMKMKRSGA